MVWRPLSSPPVPWDPSGPGATRALTWRRLLSIDWPRLFLAFRVNVESLHAVAQGVAGDLELLGRAGQVIAVLVERVQDEFALEVGHDFINRLAGWHDGQLGL